jgi:hypothetical protein
MPNKPRCKILRSRYSCPEAEVEVRLRYLPNDPHGDYAFLTLICRSHNTLDCPDYLQIKWQFYWAHFIDVLKDSVLEYIRPEPYHYEMRMALAAIRHPELGQIWPDPPFDHSDLFTSGYSDYEE